MKIEVMSKFGLQRVQYLFIYILDNFYIKIEFKIR